MVQLAMYRGKASAVGALLVLQQIMMIMGQFAQQAQYAAPQQYGGYGGQQQGYGGQQQYGGSHRPSGLSLSPYPPQYPSPYYPRPYVPVIHDKCSVRLGGIRVVQRDSCTTPYQQYSYGGYGHGRVQMRNGQPACIAEVKIYVCPLSTSCQCQCNQYPYSYQKPVCPLQNPKIDLKFNYPVEPVDYYNYAVRVSNTYEQNVLRLETTMSIPSWREVTFYVRYPCWCSHLSILGHRCSGTRQYCPYQCPTYPVYQPRPTPYPYGPQLTTGVFGPSPPGTMASPQQPHQGGAPQMPSPFPQQPGQHPGMPGQMPGQQPGAMPAPHQPQIPGQFPGAMPAPHQPQMPGQFPGAMPAPHQPQMPHGGTQGPQLTTGVFGPSPPGTFASPQQHPQGGHPQMPAGHPGAAPGGAYGAHRRRRGLEASEASSGAELEDVTELDEETLSALTSGQHGATTLDD